MSYIDSQREDLLVPLTTSPEPHPTAVWNYPPRAASARGTKVGTEDRPVLLVHGFRGDHHGMDLIAHELRHRTVIAPDLPGFGETAALEAGLDLEAYVDFLSGLVGLLTERHGTPPVLVGHSFGSILAAHFAAAHPDIAELVLINPITQPPLAGPDKFLTATARLYYAAGAKLPEHLGNALLSNSLIVRAMSQVMATTDDPGLRSFIHDQHSRYFSTYADRDSLQQAFEVSISRTAAEAAASLTMPVLVIAGEADSIAPLAATRDFVDTLPAAVLEAFPGVGHLVHYERPVEAAEAIEGFLSSPE